MMITGPPKRPVPLNYGIDEARFVHRSALAKAKEAG